MHPGIGLIIIGDEILSGKRRDRHFDNALALLKSRGLALNWSLIIGDNPEQIRDTLKSTFLRDEIVFCFGGIGATPDDYTRQCVAEVLGEPLIRHPEAIREIEAQYGKEGLHPVRVLMAEIPRNSRIIPNPYNRIPGFSVQRHHFLPGFPQMAEPMMAWLLDNEYREYFGEDAVEEVQLDLLCHEGRIIEMMKVVGENNPRVKLSSLPRLDLEKPLIEFCIRGEGESLKLARIEVESFLEKMDIAWQEH